MWHFRPFVSTLTTHDTLVSFVCGWVRAGLTRSGQAAPVYVGALSHSDVHWDGANDRRTAA